MSLIEGVGDEVTVGVSVFVMLCLLLLAWLSTHTRDIPFVSIIVVELSQRRNRARGISQPPASSSSAVTEEGGTASQRDGERGFVVFSGDDGTSSSNNNAHTVNDDDGEEETVATSSASKSAMPEAVTSSNTDNKTETDATKVVEEGQPSRTVASVSDNVGSGHEVNATTSQSQPHTSLEAATVISPSGVEESATTAVIPELKMESGTSDEIRRRRVAYFESGKESKTDKCAMTGASPESEQSSLGAQSQVGTTDHGGSITEAPLSSSEVDAVPSPSGALPRDASLPSTGEASPTLSDSLVEGQSSPGEDSMSGAAEAGSDEGTSAKAEETPGGNVTQSSEDREQQIRVRLKYLNDTQRLVFTDPLETVGNFRRLHFSSELEDNKIVRFIFNGQDLRNDLSTLSAYNVADNSVIHCLITQSRQQEENAAAQHHAHEEDSQMGEMIFPIFGLILGLVWYLRLTYKHYFNAMSTVSLAGISFIYVLALFSSMRHRRRPHQHLD